MRYGDTGQKSLSDLGIRLHKGFGVGLFLESPRGQQDQGGPGRREHLVPATQEAEAGGSLEPRSPWLASAM